MRTVDRGDSPLISPSLAAEMPLLRGIGSDTAQRRIAPAIVSEPSGSRRARLPSRIGRPRLEDAALPTINATASAEAPAEGRMDGSPDILRGVDVDVDVSTTVGSGVRTTGEASTPGS